MKSNVKGLQQRLNVESGKSYIRGKMENVQSVAEDYKLMIIQVWKII